MGCGQYLKPLNLALQIVAVEPLESPVLSSSKAGPHKIQGIGTGFIPRNADTLLYDEVIQVSGEEAMAMARKLAMKRDSFVAFHWVLPLWQQLLSPSIRKTWASILSWSFPV